jgi:signal transduction histidine kinase/CheY-like chemotaxis protein
MIFSSSTSIHKKLLHAWLAFLLLLAVLVGLFFWHIIGLQKNTVISELQHEVVLIRQMLEDRLLFNSRQARGMASDNSLRVLLQLELWSQTARTLGGFSRNNPVRAAWILGTDEVIKTSYPASDGDFCPMTLSGPSERYCIHKGRLNHLVRRPIYSRDHVLQGFLVLAFVFPDQFFLDHLGNDQNQYAALVKDNQIVAAATHLDLEDLSQPGIFDTKKIHVHINGTATPVISAQSRISLFEDSLTLYLLRDLQPLQEPLYTLALLLAGLALLTACGCFAFYMYLKRRIILPIISLSRAAHQVRMTDSIVPLRKVVYPSPARDEIHSLINSFKAMAGHLHKAREEAESLSTMKDAFLATVSHEIRTPLNGIFGMTQLLQRSGLTSQQDRYAANMLLSIHNLLSIINDVLDVSKIRAKGLEIKPERVHLCGLLESIQQTHVPAASAAAIDMRLVCTDLPTHVVTDPLRLQQVLNNLVGNALKFTHSGHVLLQARCLSLEKSSGTVQIEFSVEDTGIGIPRDRQASIFQPFTQVDSGLARKYPGTGLGLAIASEIVSLLGGGSIAIESTPGKGSRFSFSLDLAYDNGSHQDNEDVQPSAASHDSVDGSSYDRLNILVAEDNPMNQELIRETFDLLGIHSFHICSNGQEALDELAARPTEYDLLLLDIQMPGMDGFTVARTIRDQGNTLPIVAITGLAGDKHREKSRQCGIDHFLSKPFTLEDLESILCSVMSNKSASHTTLPIEH